MVSCTSPLMSPPSSPGASWSSMAVPRPSKGPAARRQEGAVYEPGGELWLDWRGGVPASLRVHAIDLSAWCDGSGEHVHTAFHSSQRLGARDRPRPNRHLENRQRVHR